MNKKVNPIASVAIFIVLISIVYFYSKWNNKKIHDRIVEHAGFSTGYFTRIKNTKGSRLAVFRFYVADKLCGSSIGSGAIEKIWPYVTDKYFPVIYNKEDPEESEILVFRWDFEHYDLPFPDSLQWVQDLYDQTQQPPNR